MEIIRIFVSNFVTMAEEVIIEHNESFWKFRGAVDYLDDWFLMGSPFPMLLILASYLFFVLKCGPKFMQNQPAYEMRNILLGYNAFQVAYSLYLVYFGVNIISKVGLTEPKCMMDDEAMKYSLVTGTYFYFLAKLSEFLDTIFFVLRKKWNQVSFLHVYHHFIMYFATWITLKYEPTYSVIFMGTLNAFVHVIMYTYYGLSAYPGLAKYLWWKKYITKLQLIQFVTALIQVTWNYKVTPCRPSYILLTIIWLHGFLFIYLFTKFYINSYTQKRKEDQALKNKEGTKVSTQKVLDKRR